MSRRGGFILGILGLILPGYLFYITYETMFGKVTIFSNQGFFYIFNYKILPSGLTETSSSGVIARSWFTSDRYWTGNTELYLYLGCFVIAVLGLFVLLGNTKGGSLLLLGAGILNLGLMLVRYSHIEDIFRISNWNGYPIPVGAIILIIAGLLGNRD